MHLEQLKYFEAAARLGSFSKAAAAYAISHQGLGKSIASLEKEIGVPLFERSNQGIHLTSEGSAFLTIVQRFLRDYASFSSSLPDAQLRCVVEGTIPLYVTPRIMDIYLFPLLQDFKSRYANADVALASLAYDDIIAGMQVEPQGVFLASFLKEDIAPFLQALRAVLPDVAHILWIQEQMCLCGHKDLLHVYGLCVSETDLKDLEICTDAYLKAGARENASPPVRYKISSYGLKVNLLLSKQCLTYVNRLEFETHYAHYGDLEMLPLEKSTEVQTLCFYRQIAGSSTAKEALLDFIRSDLRRIE